MSFTYTTYFILEYPHLFRMCPECQMGLHTQCQARACKKQNPNILFTSKTLKHYYPKSWLWRMIF